MNDDVNISLSPDAALVLLSLVSRLNEGDLVDFEDQAEQRVLWDLESLLESSVATTLATDYATQLRHARDRLRDDE